MSLSLRPNLFVCLSQPARRAGLDWCGRRCTARARRDGVRSRADLTCGEHPYFPPRTGGCNVALPGRNRSLDAVVAPGGRWGPAVRWRTPHWTLPRTQTTHCRRIAYDHLNGRDAGVGRAASGMCETAAAAPAPPYPVTGYGTTTRRFNSNPIPDSANKQAVPTRLASRMVAWTQSVPRFRACASHRTASLRRPPPPVPARSGLQRPAPGGQHHTDHPPDRSAITW